MTTIVLAHGVLGFGSVFPGIPQLVHYFNQVAGFLQGRFPDIDVFEPSVSPVGSVHDRAAQLGKFIRDLDRDVDVIAHSMGGLDARAAVHDPTVARHVRSITTIGTPHAGSEVADAIVERRGPLVGHIPQPIVDLLERFGPALHDLTMTHVPKFADVHPIAYREIAGNAAQSRHESLLFRLSADFARFVGPNDGMVTIASATRPERDLFDTWPFDHGGEVGWNLVDALPVPFIGALPHLQHYATLIEALRR